MKSAVAPSPLAFCLKAGVAINLAISVDSRSMTGRGVFAGANTPNHEVASSFGRPASAAVGTEGSEGRRAVPGTARARHLPEGVKAMKGGGVPNINYNLP